MGKTLFSPSFHASWHRHGHLAIAIVAGAIHVIQGDISYLGNNQGMSKRFMDRLFVRLRKPNKKVE